MRLVIHEDEVDSMDWLYGIRSKRIPMKLTVKYQSG